MELIFLFLNIVSTHADELLKNFKITKNPVVCPALQHDDVFMFSSQSFR